MEAPPLAGVLRFGELALDLATGELQGARASPIALGARPTRLLALLAWRHGQLVTREQIQREVWADGTTVDFDQSINQHVRQLRQLLGDDAAHPTWIQTLPGRGYRFLVASALDPAAPAPARDADTPQLPGAAQQDAETPRLARDADTPRFPDVALQDADAPQLPGAAQQDADAPALASAAPQDVHVAAPSLERRSRRRTSARLMAALVGPALAVLLLTSSRSGSSTASGPGAHDAGAIRIAVLPLDSEDPGEQPRAVAMTDELITALGEAYAPRLEVIAPRTVMRYRGSTLPLPAIARELGVDLVLEGRLRSHADRLRINVRLVRARDSAQLWARTFEPLDASTIEAAIAQDVAAALGRVLLPTRARPDAALDVESQHAYHRGRYLLRRGDGPSAAKALAQVTARVPRSARAWAALALAELRSDGPRSTAAVAAASTALEIDPAHAEAHYVRGAVALYGEWDPERARRHFEAAIAANPAFAEAHHAIAGAYSATGRHHEAIAAMQRAFALDPQAPEVVSDVGWYYYFARRYADAAEWCRRTLALDARFYWAHRCIVMARQRQGDRPAAIAAALDDLRARRAPASVVLAVSANGLAPYWRWERDRHAPAIDAADRAVAQLALGDTASALEDLERAVTSRRGWLVPFLAVDPTFDELHGQPRFEAVLREVAAGAAL